MIKHLLCILILTIVLYIFIYKYLNYKKREKYYKIRLNDDNKELNKILNYDWKTEPNNPFYTNNMIIPQMHSNYSGECVKLNYLNNSNKPYLDIENDLINVSLIPKKNELFAYP
jgi:hypothetical protein